MKKVLRFRVAACAVFLLCMATAIVSPAQTFSVLYSFTGTGGDGANPYAGVVRDGAGNIYGTTVLGGSVACFGCGTVFEVNANGMETVLYSFVGLPIDGEHPASTLIQDSVGNLYGTTKAGGDGSCPTYGCGTVFKLDTTGMETVLYSFAGGTDGVNPGNLLMDSADNLYGTTNLGGTSGLGTVFKLGTTGKETILYSFTGQPRDGSRPDGTLVRDSAGNLYGTTNSGGVGPCSGGCGTVFKLSPTRKETVLHYFSGSTDGAGPAGGLIRDAVGNLYGTTSGCTNGVAGGGTVFKLDTTRKLSVLYTFGGTNGICPTGTLVQDAAGNFYGTTIYGGGGGAGCHFGCGTVFKLDTTGKETVLHAFTIKPSDGEYPYGDLIQDAAGNLYGTTSAGGALGYGTVWKLTP